MVQAKTTISKAAASRARKGAVRGQNKLEPDTDNPAKNPLLLVENKADFTIETGNLLQDTGQLIYDGFENFDLKKDKDHFDLDKITEDSVIVILLRYYEYLCVAEFRFSYVLPLLQSGLNAKEVFDMVKHCLKNRLLTNVPTFDTIFEPDIQYTGKIKYR